jgi:hypothetical protein
MLLQNKSTDIKRVLTFVKFYVNVLRRRGLGLPRCAYTYISFWRNEGGFGGFRIPPRFCWRI